MRQRARMRPSSINAKTMLVLPASIASSIGRS
jgi:hypothetical protein